GRLIGPGGTSVAFFTPGLGDEPRPGAFFHGEMAMSNMRDAVGLCIPYGKANSQYETEFEPATGTIWGYFKPRGTACFSLGLLKDIRRHDSALATNGGMVDIGGGEMQTVNYYVCGSRDPQVFNLGGDLALFVLLIKARDRDVLAPNGGGETAVREWIANNWKRRNGTQAVLRARQLVNPITREELDAIADVWIDAALRIQDKDLKMMGRIVRSQMRRMEQGDLADISAAALAEEALAVAAAG